MYIGDKFILTAKFSKVQDTNSIDLGRINVEAWFDYGSTEILLT